MHARTWPRSASFAPADPRTGLSALLAILAAAGFCAPTWPGLMSYDSLFAWKESIDGIETAIWPPMQAYLFALSRALGAGPGGLFFGQTALLFFGAFACLGAVSRSLLAQLVGCLLFCFAFVAVPVLWGTLAVLWKDVTTTSFALLAVALWLLAVRSGRVAFLVAAALSIGVSVALRYNALPLTAFVMALMIAAPFGATRRRFGRVATAGLLVGALGLAALSTVFRLPDGHRLPPGTGFAAVQEFDLIGITACAGVDYLPPAVSNGEPISPAEVRQLYDPRHVQLAFRAVPGLPRLYETDGDGAVPEAWRRTVPRELGCYLRHRARVFRQQMGLAPVLFYPTHGGIDANPYGLDVAHPAWTAAWIQWLLRATEPMGRRPAVLYGLALLLVAVAVWRRTPARALLVALGLGAFAYPATLFFVGPAADARYIFPSSATCALLIVASLLDLHRELR